MKVTVIHASSGTHTSTTQAAHNVYVRELATSNAMTVSIYSTKLVQDATRIEHLSTILAIASPSSQSMTQPTYDVNNVETI